MTVDITPVYVVYVVTDSTIGTEYVISFPYLSDTDLNVFYSEGEDETRVVTYLTQGVDYTVAGQVLTSVRVYPLGARLAIYRQTELTQEILWVDGQAVYPPSIMKADDKLTFIAQELSGNLARAIRVPIDMDITPEEFTDALLVAAEGQVVRAAAEADRAATEADRAATEADRAATEADRSASEADRAESILDDVEQAAIIAIGEGSQRATWKTENAITAGSTLALPVVYAPERHTLLLLMDGLGCYPSGPSVPAGAPQYDELGALGELSSSVRILFDVPAGAIWSAWVVAPRMAALQIEPIYARLDAVEITANANKVAVTSLQTQIDNLGAGITPDLTVIENNITAIRADITTLQTGITNLQDQDTAIWVKLNDTANNLNNHISDINTAFASLSSKVQAIPVTKVWVSSEQPLSTAFSILSVIHGQSLPSNLSLVRAEILLKCLVAEGGYSVGMLAMPWAYFYTGANMYDISPLSAQVTSTEISAPSSGYYPGVMAHSRLTGTYFYPAVANWRFIFRMVWED